MSKELQDKIRAMPEAELEKAYLAGINHPNPVKGTFGDMYKTAYEDRVLEGRYPVTTGLTNLGYDLSAGAGLLGGPLRALSASPYGRATDYLFNMASAWQSGLPEDPYGDYELSKTGGAARYVPRRHTGYSGDVARTDSQDAAMMALQWHPVTRIPATLLSGRATLDKHDAVRAKKAPDIRDIQEAIRNISPTDPNRRKLLLHYTSLLKGLSGTGEVARGTTGQMAYMDLNKREGVRRQVQDPARIMRSAALTNDMAAEARVPELALRYGDELIDYEADVSKVQNSVNGITYPVKRFASWGTDFISFDRLLDTISGTLPGGYFSDQNVQAYKARRKFRGEAPPLGMAENGPDQRAEIHRLAEEAYPGISSDQYLQRRGETIKATDKGKKDLRDLQNFLMTPVLFR